MKHTPHTQILTALILILLSTVAAASASATAGVYGIVEHVELGQGSKIVRDQRICLTFVKTDTEVLGIVEDYYSCDFARVAKNKIGQRIHVKTQQMENLADLDEEDFHQRMLEINSDARYLLLDLE